MVQKSVRAGRIWIAWETQRRSITLAGLVGAELHILELEHLGKLRYPVSIVRTMILLARNRGGVVFVQNPSMVLAALAAFLKPVFRYTLIVDRHSNFPLPGERVSGATERVLGWLSAFSIRRADVTIVTNTEIADRYVRGVGRAGHLEARTGPSCV